MSELTEENGSQFPQRRRPPSTVELGATVLATDDQVDHYRGPDFPRIAYLHDGDSSVVFPAFELIPRGQKPRAHRRPRHQHRRRRYYLVQGQDIRHNVVDRR